MPIYEYNCQDCSKTFEKIIWKSEDKEVSCPYCQGKNTIRVLSAFSKGGGAGQDLAAASNCGPSSGGFS